MDLSSLFFHEILESYQSLWRRVRLTVILIDQVFRRVPT
jgi:hypothetical protein